MTADKNEAPASTRFDVATVEVAVRIGLVGLLGYWALKVISPFLTIALWSVILAVALYPLFDWLARQLRSRRLAATLITLLCLMIVVGPVTWLGFGLTGGVELLITELGPRATVDSVAP